MPIRFRCRYCNQLLGIARRKAGTMVRCPTCQCEVAVPAADEEPAPGPASPPPPPPARPEPAPALFERDDFEDFLHGSLPASDASRPRGHAHHTPPPAPRPQPAPAVPVPPPPPAPLEQNGWQPALAPAHAAPIGGLVLSPARATVLTVVVILLLAVAFALGLLVGRFVL